SAMRKAPSCSGAHWPSAIRPMAARASSRVSAREDLAPPPTALRNSRTTPTIARMELAGKTALVTGAARRVGRAIAEELERAGARVVAHSHSSPGGVRADLRDPAAAQLLVDEALRLTGRLDLLINSAAGYAR